MLTIIKKMDPRVVLSTLWIFAILNYLYADVIGFYEPGFIEDLLDGTVAGIEFTDSFLLVMSIMMQTAIVMVLFSRILVYKAARWTNIIAGVIHTFAVGSSMFVGEEAPGAFYVFFGTIEMLTTIFIVWFAWNWKEKRD
ncbi:MAG: DUF6326 family protein [Candidatus Saccharimonadales bacterium]|nr:DUF6326 family protein [Candidatus Saccharimonadales bacterium]